MRLHFPAPRMRTKRFGIRLRSRPFHRANDLVRQHRQEVGVRLLYRVQRSMQRSRGNTRILDLQEAPSRLLSPAVGVALPFPLFCTTILKEPQ
jgi:hypothetical protein